MIQTLPSLDMQRDKECQGGGFPKQFRVRSSPLTVLIRGWCVSDPAQVSSGTGLHAYEPSRKKVS